MLSNLTENNFDPVFSYLKTHKYHNLHTRHTKQVKGERVLKHLHGMKLKNKNCILGYFCGPIKNNSISEIEYEIDDKGNVTISKCIGIKKNEALTYFEKELRRILNRATQPNQNWNPKYKNGNFYLRRRENKEITNSGRTAIQDAVLSEEFVKKMAEWNLSIIEGSH